MLNADGTAHESNGRATIDDDDNDFWFGFEQEYFIMDKNTQLPLGFPLGGYPGPQGLYYCSVGGRNTHGREFVEEHDLLFIVEQNRDGQMRTLLMAEGGVIPDKLVSVLCFNGQPITADFISNKISAHLSGNPLKKVAIGK